MWNLGVFLFCLFTGCVFEVFSDGDVGEGVWSVLSIKKCPEDDSMKIRMDIERRKLDRSTDCFNAKLSLPETVDESYAVRIESCKEVDGGCKPYQTLADDSVVRMVKKYAENNCEAALTLAGVDPPDFPISNGDYEINEYVIDYCELPPKAPYGKYVATAYLVQNSVDVACLVATVEFAVDDNCKCRPAEECE